MPSGMPGSPKDPIDRWIASVVPGHSFVDIGGIGMNSSNERVTFAQAAGASRAAMADIRPFSYHEWTTFDRKLVDAGVADVDRYDNIDITRADLTDRLPRFDVVHCTGIFYHLPNPVDALRSLDRVVGRHLIINTVTVPDHVENAAGRLDFSGNVALFLPGINAHERAVLGAHYKTKFGWSIDDVAPALEAQDGAKMPYIDKGEFSCWPYWWLMSDTCFRSLLRLMRYRIDAEWKWEDHTLACLCSRTD
jgi:hypothetical protein